MRTKWIWCVTAAVVLLLAPARLVAKGVAGAKKGEAVSVIWQGGDRWLVRHEPSGKQFPWRWQTQPAERKKK